MRGPSATTARARAGCMDVAHDSNCALASRDAPATTIPDGDPARELGLARSRATLEGGSAAPCRGHGAPPRTLPGRDAPARRPRPPRNSHSPYAPRCRHAASPPPARPGSSGMRPRNSTTSRGRYLATRAEDSCSAQQWTQTKPPSSRSTRACGLHISEHRDRRRAREGHLLRRVTITDR